MKTWAQICKHCTVHQLSENTNTEIIIICKKKKIFNSDRALCKSGSVQDSEGRVQDSEGWVQRPQRYDWLERWMVV